MSDKYILGIDIGTTSISFVVLDEKENIIEAFNKESPHLTEEKTTDPNVIYSSVKCITDEIIGKYCVKSIGFTGQMHGILFTDENLKALSPLYTWQFSPKGEYLNEIKAITGENIYSGYGLATYYYLKKKGTAPENSFKILTIMDFTANKLADNRDIVMHSSNAASLGLYDIEKAEFKLNKVESLNLDVNLLPKVSAENKIIGYYKSIPVYIPIGDNQASVFAVYKENSIVLNYGTGSQVSLITDCFKEVKGIETRPFMGNKYMLCGAALSGGRAYSLLEKFFRSFLKAANAETDDVYGILNELALKAESKDLVVSPKFAGSRENPSEKGAVTNISEVNFTPENLTYGFLKGMAKELYDFYKLMGETREKVLVTGNAARKNPALIKATVEVFNIKTEFINIREEAAFGAALFALKGGNGKF